MGIPKFFRWISERYPLISQLIEGDNIPEFDNLYLDMNGILHNCTHKDSDDATFRMSEADMYLAIIRYIEFLFDKIKPRKVFFMAIDGVAPRAKMNQQRSRRFRTALDAENARKKAIKEGTVLPTEPPFDTNALTPGTEFMAKLSVQLNYFISRKVSEDSRWQNVEVILSGHEVPGEGEHKIMEYIRTAKMQPDYNSNTRHCFYGLDADLIMLGLISHDPHFALLREEVVFGSRNVQTELYHRKFFLLHLSLVREYLELEFQSVKHDISFPYDFERVLDDFILLCIFVGNDFLPNLPRLEINEGALTVMFAAYKAALPHCSTYLTDSGELNLQELRFLMKELVNFEFKLFEADNDNGLYLDTKSTPNGRSQKSRKGAMTMTESQKMIFDSVEDFLSKSKSSEIETTWNIPLSLVEKDVEFIFQMANKLSLNCSITDSPIGSAVSLKVAHTDFDGSDEEAEFALQRVLKQYKTASVEDSATETTAKDRVVKKFNDWKDRYYKEKLGFSYYDEAKLKEICENYIQGLQWILSYYYKGVCSWSWFFKYHYAPRISDISKGIGANLNFELGAPFRPFEQLMAVLPDLSNLLMPFPYRELMHDPNSPIVDFYPTEIELDLNGKKMDWEAVVKIPFVDQDRLLAAMKPKEAQLTVPEKKRNSFGRMLKFKYDSQKDESYTSSMESVFPDLEHNKCRIEEFTFPPTDGRQYKSYLCTGVLLGSDALAGFPTLKTIPHTAEITARHMVNVFQQDSRREAIIVTLENLFEDLTTEQIAQKTIGSKIYVGWPYISEAKVIGVSDEMFDYSLINSNGKDVVTFNPKKPNELMQFDNLCSDIYKQYGRLGVDINDVRVIVTVAPLKGLKQLHDGALVKAYDETPGARGQYAVQTTLSSVSNEDERFKERPALLIAEQFPVGTRGFYLGADSFAQPMQVIDIVGPHHATIYTYASQPEDVSFGRTIVAEEQRRNRYLPSMSVCRTLHISGLLLSKITSSFMVTHGEQNGTANIGLNLKFQGKNQKVLGYTRRTEGGWEYSQKAVDLLREYMASFPDLFRGLTKQMNTDRPKITALLGLDDASAKKRLDEIRVWQKAKAALISGRVPVDWEQLSAEAVKQIESFVDALPPTMAEPLTIPRASQASILKPTDAIHRLGNQRFFIGDRVIYVKDSGSVPIALKGTVVGICSSDGRKSLDVVFDHTFLGGTTLGGRCSSDRGMTVELSSVVNLTTRELEYKPHSKKPIKPSRNGRAR